MAMLFTFSRRWRRLSEEDGTLRCLETILHGEEPPTSQMNSGSFCSAMETTTGTTSSGLPYADHPHQYPIHPSMHSIYSHSLCSIIPLPQLILELLLMLNRLLHILPFNSLQLVCDGTKYIKTWESLSAKGFNRKTNWSMLFPSFFEVVNVGNVWTAQLSLYSIFVCIDLVKFNIPKSQTYVSINLPFSWTTLANAPTIGLTFLQVGQNSEYS